MELDRDGFAQDQAIAFNDSLNRIDFALENRSHDAHDANLQLRGLPAGSYNVLLDRVSIANFVVQAGGKQNVKLPVPANGGSVTLSRK